MTKLQLYKLFESAMRFSLLLAFCLLAISAPDTICRSTAPNDVQAQEAGSTPSETPTAQSGYDSDPTPGATAAADPTPVPTESDPPDRCAEAKSKAEEGDFSDLIKLLGDRYYSVRSCAEQAIRDLAATVDPIGGVDIEELYVQLHDAACREESDLNTDIRRERAIEILFDNVLQYCSSLEPRGQCTDDEVLLGYAEIDEQEFAEGDRMFYERSISFETLVCSISFKSALELEAAIANSFQPLLDDVYQHIASQITEELSDNIPVTIKPQPDALNLICKDDSNKFITTALTDHGEDAREFVLCIDKTDELRKFEEECQKEHPGAFLTYNDDTYYVLMKIQYHGVELICANALPPPPDPPSAYNSGGDEDSRCKPCRYSRGCFRAAKQQHEFGRDERQLKFPTRAVKTTLLLQKKK